jgi:hypothetical protein
VLLCCLEVGEEGGVLREVSLDFLEARFEPALEAALSDLVLDAVKVQVAVNHDQMIGIEGAAHNGPDGLT